MRSRIPPSLTARVVNWKPSKNPCIRLHACLVLWRSDPPIGYYHVRFQGAGQIASQVRHGRKADMIRRSLLDGRQAPDTAFKQRT